MNEIPLGNLPKENPKFTFDREDFGEETFELENLTFDQRREIHQLAERTFRVTDQGVESVDSFIVKVAQRGEIWKVVNLDKGTNTFSRQVYDRFAYLMVIGKNVNPRSALLQSGSRDLQEIITEITKFMEEITPELGIRLID